MATYYARTNNGNVNGAIWALTPTGATISPTPYPFTSNDVLVANGNAVTVGVNLTVKEIRTDATGGATQGGSFYINPGVTVTANAYTGSAQSVISINAGSGTVTINGNVFGGYAQSVHGITHGSAPAALIVNGNVYGGFYTSANGIYSYGAGGSITINGDVFGGPAGIANGVMKSGTNNLTVNGNVTGGSACVGLYFDSSGTAQINGTVTGGPNTVNPNVSFGAQNNGAGTMTVTRAKGNDAGPGSPMQATAGVYNSSTGTLTVSEIEYGSRGQSPTYGAVAFANSTANKVVVYRGTTTKKTLADSSVTSPLVPAARDVRAGVSYNGTTGSCVIPAADSVVAGVAVGSTTGTAVLSTAALWDELTSTSRVSGSYGERLKTAATVATTGQQLTNALN